MAELAAPARFDFDLDLGQSGDKATLIDEAALQKLLAQARAEARAEGRAEGEAGAAARAAEAIATAARDLAGQSARFAAALDAAVGRTRAEAAELATLIARKLAAHLVDSRPAAEIDALIAECLASLERVPHLVIRCHPDLADAVTETARTRAAELGFDGRLVIMGEPDIALGDCRIDWADGGVVRDSAALEAAVDKAIRHYLGASPPVTGDAPSSPGEDQ